MTSAAVTTQNLRPDFLAQKTWGEGGARHSALRSAICDLRSRSDGLPWPIPQHEHDQQREASRRIADPLRLLHHRHDRGGGEEEGDDPDREDDFARASVALDEDVVDVAAVGGEDAGET